MFFIIWKKLCYMASNATQNFFHFGGFCFTIWDNITKNLSNASMVPSLQTATQFVRVVVRATVWQQICRVRALARARQICCQALARTDNPLNVRRVSHWNFISSLWNLNSCFVESIWQSVASKSCRWEISFICHTYVF